MLSRIRATPSSYRNVKVAHLRATCASSLLRKTFGISACHQEKPPQDQTGQHADSTVDDFEGGHGEYTSLDSKLDHYPTTPSEHTYQPSQQPLSSLLPLSPSANHSSQRTFLTHSRRTGLNPASAVFTGTRYEYLTLGSLRRLGIELARVGGTGDRGLDLVGFWHLPQWSHSSIQSTDPNRTEEGQFEQPGESIRVVVQCKRISPTARASKSIGPSVVRELEGAFRGAPTGWRAREGVLGMLVSTRSATKGVKEGMRRSERALAWVLLEEVESARCEVLDSEESGTTDEDGSGLQDHKRNGEGDEADDSNPEDRAASAIEYKMVKGRIKQILWNQKARELGLGGLDVVKRYANDNERDTGDDVVLMWNGKAVERLPTEQG